MATTEYKRNRAEDDFWASEVFEVLAGALGKGVLLIAGTCCLIPGMVLSLGCLLRLAEGCYAHSSRRCHAWLRGRSTAGPDNANFQFQVGSVMP